jgi:hypothetical protein
MGVRKLTPNCAPKEAGGDASSLRPNGGGTPGKVAKCPPRGDCHVHGTYDRTARADRYRKVAAEYAGMSEEAADPFLGSYYLRIAEDYLAQSQGELRASEREKVAALASSKPTPSSIIPANAKGERLPSREGEARGGRFAAGGW